MSVPRNKWLQEVRNKQEDLIIQKFVVELKLKKWTKIAKSIEEELGIKGRTGKQCRERWHNHLNPELKKEEWSQEDEMKIFELQKQFGNKWSEIAEHMPGRTDNSIKNCFYSAIRRNLRKYNKRKNESEKLKGSIKNLLKKPRTREILINLKGKDLVKPIEIGNFEKGDNRPNEIICPSVSPLNSLPYFSFPFTPSTTPSVMSSRYAPGFFDFSERVDELSYVGGIVGKDSEMSLELVKSECNTPHYVLPQFSPAHTFQHYTSPRNSFSK